MAVSETPRHKLKQYSAGTDPHPTRTTFNGEVAKLEELPAIKQGSTGARPVSGVGKVLYWDEAVKRFVYDDGTEWNDVAPIGGVTPTGVAIAGAASEGTSPRAARADHTHPLPLATTAAHGAMRNTDKAKLDAATSAANASTVMSRDAAGRTQVATPNIAADAATKGYVDSGLAGKSANTHSHASATTSAPGFMSAADKAKLDVIPTIGESFSSGILTPNNDWAVVAERASKYGPVVSAYLSLKRIGGAIPGNPSGNIPNVEIGSMTTNFRPNPTLANGTLSTASVGIMVSAFVQAEGPLFLSALPPNIGLSTGEALSIQGTWITD